MLIGYVGIDASLNGTGIALIDQMGKFAYTRVISHGPKPSNIPVDRRIQRIEARLEESITNMRGGKRALTVILEDHRVGRKGMASLYDIGRVDQAIFMLLDRLRIHRYSLPIQTIKRFATGNGNSPKSVMVAKVLSKWGVDFTESQNPDDRADAYAMARIAYAICEDAYAFAYERTSLAGRGLTREFLLENLSFEGE